MSFPTPQQKKAIENRGAMLVSAAAGSGKTAVLVERVVQCVTDPHNPVDIDRLLVVTFTKAAAAEMKERIRKRLAEEYEKDPQNQRLLTQQILLAKADISTIDSFCKNLVTRYFDRLDLSPDFTLVSGNRLDLMKRAAMEETLNHFFATQQEDFTHLAQTLGADNGTDRLEIAIEKVYEYLRTLPFPQQWTDYVRGLYHSFSTMGQSPWGEVLLDRGERIVQGALRTIKSALAFVEENDPVVAEKRGDGLREYLWQLERVQDAILKKDWDGVGDACRLLQKISFQGKNLPRGYESQGKQISNNAQEVSAAVSEKLKDMFGMSEAECALQCEELAPMIDLLLDSVWEYYRRIDAKKREEGCMDFSDVEYAALSLLVELKDGEVIPTPEAREILDDYSYVMVDEYQDVNDLQSTIFTAISGGGKNLFAVGDVKQSIYCFRKANPRNFLKMMDEYPLYDGKCSPAKLILDGNFRSREQVCNTVNGLFSLIMSAYVGEVNYDNDHRLSPSRQFPPTELPVCELEFLSAEDDRTAIELEADRIAQHIRTSMETPCVTQKDGSLRPARYGDCVILLRGLKNRGRLYAERLQAQGIPAVTEQADGFFQRSEVARLLGVLQAIDNPTDDVALLSCMMSPLFGFTADQVAQVRGRDKYIPLYISLERSASEGNPRAASLITTLQDLRAYAATVSAPRLMTRLFEAYGYLAAVRVMENGEQCRRNLLYLREMAVEYAENGQDRLDGFLRYLRRLQEEEVAVNPPSAGVDGDVVRIMTIHNAKGLQFPLCFVAGCGTKFNLTDGNAPLLLDEQLGLGLTVTDDVRRSRMDSCMRWGIHYRNRRAELSEELRVLYVALTRAVDRLFLLATYSNSRGLVEKASMALAGGVRDGKLDSELVLSAPDYGRLLMYFALLHPAGNALRGSLPVEEDWLACDPGDCAINLVSAAEIAPAKPKETTKFTLVWDPTLYQEIQEQLSYRDPYAPLREVFAKRSVSQLSHDQPLMIYEQAPRPSFVQKSGMSATQKGTALHNFMQFADYGRAATDLQGELDRLIERRFLTPQQGEQIDKAKVQRFFDGALYRRMAESPLVMREHRFMSRIPVTQLDETIPQQFANETVVVQGITDCVFEEDGQLVVVDYKTDRVNSGEELANRYAKQLRLYAKMLSETREQPVKELLLYSFALDQVISVPIEE